MPATTRSAKKTNEASTPPQDGPRKSKKEEWDEPATKWGKSKARKLLYKDIMNGQVPRTAKDANGKSTMKLKDIYEMHEDYKKYHYSKFSGRVARMRSLIDERESRKDLDQQAFDNYVSSHQISFFSHKGYIQWQGSDAQEFALEDIKNNVHNTTKWKVWHGQRREFYEHFPLDAFRDKIKQEIRTAKYLHTLEVRGKDTRKTKDMSNEI